MSATDLLILQAIHNYGVLSTPQIYELVKEHCSSILYLKRRLRDLNHEDCIVFDGKEYQGPLLCRPSAQLNTHNARSNYLVYMLDDAGERILQAIGHWSENRPKGISPFAHACFASTIQASLAVGFRERGFRWQPQHEFLDLKKTTLGAPVPYWWDGMFQPPRTLRSDGLAVADYNGSYRLFEIEADRGTEAADTNDDEKKSLKRNVLQWQQFIQEGIYKQHYHTEKVGLIVLNFFTTQRRLENFLAIVEQETGANRYQWAKVVPEFHGLFRPQAILPDIYRTPFKRAGYPDIDIFDPQAR